MTGKKHTLSEEAASKIAIGDHPEWKRDYENGTLPDEIIGADGQPMSPRMHLSIHVIVERQLAADDPQGVVAVAEELSRLGISHHDIRHEIGRAVANQIWGIQQGEGGFDEDEYFSDLKEIVDSHR